MTVDTAAMRKIADLELQETPQVLYSQAMANRTRLREALRSAADELDELRKHHDEHHEREQHTRDRVNQRDRFQQMRQLCAVCGETRAVHGAEPPHTRGNECSGFIPAKPGGGHV